jgi:hypothetical protein
MKTPPSLVATLGLAVTCAHLVGRASSFTVHRVVTSTRPSSSSSCVVALAAKRAKKESMSAKRARRQSRQQCTLDFPERPKIQLVEEESPASSSEAAVETPTTASADSPMSKAQKLLATQRRSVAMLTLVKERIDQIPSDDLTQALAEQGYYVCDNFLNDPATLDELQAEAVVLLDQGSLTPDMDNLASGEYVGPVQGGEEQYPLCPRSIEWVVSTTKHFGALVASSSSSAWNLDDKKCMGRMRTYDRQAFQAAKDLLMAEGEDDDDAAASDNSESTEKPFQCLVNLDDASDQRRLSLRYYLLPSAWSFGGGMEFETGSVVLAQRDRLVIWKSAESPLRSTAWEGDAAHRYGSCLELDLLQKVA